MCLQSLSRRERERGSEEAKERETQSCRRRSLDCRRSRARKTQQRHANTERRMGAAAAATSSSAADQSLEFLRASREHGAWKQEALAPDVVSGSLCPFDLLSLHCCSCSRCNSSLSLSLPFAHSTLTRREVKESASSLLSPREKQSLPRAKGDEGMLLANHLGNTFPAPLRERRCGTRVHASGSCNTPSRISLPLCELRSHDTTSSLRLSLRFPFLCLSLLPLCLLP